VAVLRLHSRQPSSYCVLPMNVVLVSNRVAPAGGAGAVQGGVAAALARAVEKRGALWLGWNGSLTKGEGGPVLPSLTSAGAGTIATVDLPERHFSGYYNSMANSALWPLLHNRTDLLAFDQSALASYEAINEYMARAIMRVAPKDACIWIHDYHLIMVAAFLRRLGFGGSIGFFLHTPFPGRGALTCLPCHDAIFSTLFAYDLIGFQTLDDQAYFEDYAEHELGAIPDGADTMRHGRRSVRLGVFPVGVDVGQFALMAAGGLHAPATVQLRNSLKGAKVVVGVDRLDYSKGLFQRFEAYRRFFDFYPDEKGKVSFLQITPPTRSQVAAYQQVRRQVATMVGDINGQFSALDWNAIRYVNQSYSPRTLAGLYRMSPVACVTPLRDGMNLVAKEYVAAQDPENPGALVLSQFAGAARELDAAVLVNPYDVDELARSIERALSMPLAARRERWASMMAVLRVNDIEHWYDRFVSALERIESDARLPLAAGA
jgi:trehalose 6-phosphate synthase